MLEDVDSPGLAIYAAGTGGVMITSDLSWEDVQAVVPNLREVAEETMDIRARLVTWAGPYEIYLSIKPVLEAVTVMGGSIMSVAALLTLFVRKHPDQPITIKIHHDTVTHNETKIMIDGRELSAQEAAQVNEFFAQNAGDPDETVGGSNAPA